MKKKSFKRTYKKRKKSSSKKSIFKIFLMAFYRVLCLLFSFVKRYPLITAILILACIFFIFVADNALLAQGDYDKHMRAIKERQQVSVASFKLVSLKNSESPNIQTDKKITVINPNEEKVSSDTQSIFLEGDKLGNGPQHEDIIAHFIQKTNEKESLKDEDSNIEQDNAPKIELPYDFWNNTLPVAVRNPIKNHQISFNSHAPIINVSLDKADDKILEIQKALQNFGYSEIKLSGQMDQELIKSLKNFQKLFSLKETGRIDKGTLNKMRDIDLL